MIAFLLLALVGAFAIGSLLGQIGVKLRISPWVGAPLAFVICAAWMAALQAAAERM